ncbi:MAG: GMC family oxidoreductase [Ferruginibacter sp.]|nr:GMC family oxidoreductase [Bacteroidota bacterium]MBX2917914.1 GMC family oxidoreductase [Ferruginibacter sp.]
MLIDARQLENNSQIEGDICIIGAGAAGISIALELENTFKKIILLEGGGMEYDDRIQELYNGKITGHPYYPMKASRLHYFGGSTGHWGGMCSTFDDIDFEKREWVENSGWPIKREDIAKYYPKATSILDLGPCEWNLDYWLKQDPDFKPLPLDEKVIWSKMWQFSPPTRFGKKYKDAIVNSKTIQLHIYANVVDLDATESINSITQVTVKNYAGKQHTVKAKNFILACSAMQNARVLLACNKQAPKGLGNDNDLVGRYFMEHAEIKTGELWLNHTDKLKLYLMEQFTKVRAELAISPEKQRELQVLNGSISLMPLEMSNKTIPSVKLWSNDDPRKSLDTFKKYSTLDKRNFIQRFFSKSIYQSYGLFTRVEQLPHPESRVVLSNEKDELGIPRANLFWALSPIDKKTVFTINKLLGQQIGAAGIGRVKLKEFLLDGDVQLPDYTSGGWHHLGTTRMSDDPKHGVVDANCKIHGIDNLYIAGSSCYTTGGAVNPTLTVVAISLRLANHIKEKMAIV